MYVDDLTRLRHMRDAADEAVGFARGRTRGDLDSDRLLRRALVSCLQEIGEAASKITSARQERESSIPWERIIGLRHRVVHDYVNIRLDTVWDTITKDLPALIVELDRILGAWEEPW